MSKHMDEKVHKKWHFGEVYSAFVVNTQDALNFDLDISLPEEERKKYVNIVQGNYTYTDGKDMYSASAYRCRLKDVGVHSNHRGYRGHPDFHNSKTLVNQYIDIANGWVNVRIIGVDVYHRLLVVMYDAIEGIDIRDIILDKYGHIFYRYDKNKPAK